MDSGKFRHRLLAEKRRLARMIEAYGEKGLDESLGHSISEFSTYDNHPADIGTETFEREKDFGLREDQETTMDMVEDALQRLDKGTYGICERCGKPIPEARLEAVPWTAFCVDCEAALEAAEARDWRRPAEEDVRPAFSSFNDHDRREPVLFDGEDAWQAVARWGTSNTPADTPPARDYGETYVGADEDSGFVQDVERIGDSTYDPGRAGEEGILESEEGPPPGPEGDRIVTEEAAAGPPGPARAAKGDRRSDLGRQRKKRAR